MLFIMIMKIMMDFIMNIENCSDFLFSFLLR